MAELKPCPFCGGEVEERGGAMQLRKENYDYGLKMQRVWNDFQIQE